MSKNGIKVVVGRGVVTIGETRSGRDLIQILGFTNEKLVVFGNDDQAILALDQGHDRVTVIAVVRLERSDVASKV